MFDRKMTLAARITMMAASISVRAMPEWQRHISHRLKREVLS